MRNFQDTFAWVILVVVCLWFLYLIYEAAQHVGAWPFA